MNVRLSNCLAVLILFFSSISAGNAAVVNAVADSINDNVPAASPICVLVQFGGQWVKVCKPR